MAKKSTMKAVGTEPEGKPKVFIGSSKEGLEIAEAIAINLSNSLEPHVWLGSYAPADTTLDTLEREVEECRFGVFVFTPDDDITSRDTTMKAVRDNVLWEHGLFSGKKGHRLTFIVMPRDVKLKVPSDLNGVTFATYDSLRCKSNPSVALGPACIQIARKIKNVTESEPEPRTESNLKLTGKYKSFWLPLDPDFDPSSTETMTITEVGGKLRFKSSGNKHFEWEAVGVIEHKWHIVGEWHSIRTDAEGAFVLTRSGVRGNILYGYVVGHSPKPAIMPGPWVLGRTFEDVVQGLDRFREYWNEKALDDLRKAVPRAGSGVKPRAARKG